MHNIGLRLDRRMPAYMQVDAWILLSLQWSLFMFQNLVGSLERSRSAMAEDLANLSAQNETLKKEVETIPPLKQKLEVRYRFDYLSIVDNTYP